MDLDGLAMRLARQPFQHLTTLRFWRLILGMNPNPHVLIVVEKPNEKEGQKWEYWREFLNALKKDPQSSEAGERLTESVWQFPVPVALQKANCLAATVRESGLTPRMFYSASKIEECK
jgi:hypothetical protein